MLELLTKSHSFCFANLRNTELTSFTLASSSSLSFLIMREDKVILVAGDCKLIV